MGKFWGRRVGTCRGKAIDGGGIGTIEQIEELEVGVEPDSFSEIEAFSDAHIGVAERRRNEVIAALNEIYSIEMAVAINVRRFYGKPGVVVESALRAENPAKAHFPRELDEAVNQEGVV